MNNGIVETLRKPFPADRIEWRLAMCGVKNDGSIWARCLAYIDNRAAMERLDEAFGPNWSQEESFSTIGNAAVCTVTITIAGVEGYPVRTVTGSCAVEANGDIDQFKSAASGAMKRAVVNLGVGRYLYSLPEAWADITQDGSYSGVAKDKSGNKMYFKWNPPALPKWAVPAGDTTQARATEEEDTPAKPDAPVAKVQQTAAPATSSDTNGDDPWSAQIHFGKNKGRALRDLPENTLQWYLKEWFPKPFGDKQIISKADKALRAALDKIAGVQADPGPAPISVPADDEVPF